MDLPAGNIAAAVLHLHALGVFAAGSTLGVGAATGRRTQAIAAGVGVVVAGFAVSGMAAMMGADALRWFSPFYWFNGAEPIRNGIEWRGLALLYVVGMAAAVLGIVRFTQRDLR